MTPSLSGCRLVHTPFRVLILKPSSLGDVVQALPVLRLLKRYRPESEIYWWVNDTLASLLTDDPDLKGVYLFPRRGWHSPWRWWEQFQQVMAMRRMHFDWVIDLQGLARSGLMAWLANGGLTVGVDDTREGARGFYDVAVARPSALTHAVDWYKAVLAELRVPVGEEYEWLPRRDAVWEQVQSRAGDGVWVGLQPGARWLNKRWPVDYYAELVKVLHRDGAGLKFAVLGGADDGALGRRLALAVPGAVLDLTGRTTLAEMVEWVRRCAVMVTNDTGPMHVASALGKPVVGLFGPTEPRRTGPYGQLERVLQRRELPCVPCMKGECHYRVPLDCLRGIGVETVAARVRTILGAGEGAARPGGA